MISLLCPTRGRPENVNRLLKSIFETANQIPEILFRVDDDDKSTFEPQPDYSPEKCGFVKLFIGPRITHSDYWNVLALRAKGDILMMLGDDVVFKTLNWDVQIEEAFANVPDRILCAFPDDLGPARGKFASLPIISRRWLEIAGSFTGSGYSGDWADTHLNDIADMIGRKLFVPIICEHCHYVFGKAKYDQTYEETRKRMERDNPGKLFHERLPERRAIAAKLKAAMQ